MPSFDMVGSKSDSGFTDTCLSFSWMLFPMSRSSCNGLSCFSSAAISSNAFSIAVSSRSPFSRSPGSDLLCTEYAATSAVFPSAEFLSFLRMLHPPVHPTQPSSHGPLIATITKVPQMKPTLQLPLRIQPPSAYSLFPTAVPVIWPQKVASMKAVLTRLRAFGSIA